MRRQVSREGGRSPQWSPSGDEVWFSQGQDVVAVRVALDRAGDLAVMDQRVLWTAPQGIGLFDRFAGTTYATVDGKRFLVLSERRSGYPHIGLIQNVAQLAAGR